MTRNNTHSLFLSRVWQLAVLAFIFYLCETYAVTYQQGSGPKEMDATIQTYWPRRQYTLRADSNLVEVAVVVRDSRGRAIGGLSRDDFEIEDAGRKREITAFSVETVTPAAAAAAPTVVRPSSPNSTAAVPEAKPQLRYVALVFDDFSISNAQQVYVKAAARRFVKEGLAKGDRVGLFTISGRQIMPFTADAMKLAAAVDKYNSFPRVPDGGMCPKLTQYDAYAIANKIDFESYKLKWDERTRCAQEGRRVGQPPSPPRSFAEVPMNDQLIMQAVTMWAQIRDISARALDSIDKLVNYMGQLPGKKMILLASSGLLVRTLEAEHQKVINHALRTEVIINALDAKGLYTEDPPEVVPGADARSLLRMVLLGGKEKDLSNDIMAILATGTGGLFFDNNNDLDLGFRKLGMIPEVSYVLGYSPEETPNGKYHGLKVRMKSNNRYLIQSRPGYWAVPKQQEQPPLERRVDREVLTLEVLRELPAVISSEPTTTDTGDPALEVVINVDARKYHFVEKDGLRTQILLFIATLFDDRGNFVTGTELVVKFALKESTLKRLAETGLEMSVILQAPPGVYRLRGVAQDGIDGNVVASTLPVQIR